ncbi:MAG: hypothetical protein M1816_004285 [Peltula sp. TS41687]|nr:MAG: hypothetical protein M1816_004285 [Peltula sp. TS41687]
MPSRVVRLRLPSKYHQYLSSDNKSTDDKSIYNPSRPRPRSHKPGEYLQEEWREKDRYHNWVEKYLSRIETRQHNLSLSQMMNRTPKLMTTSPEEELHFRNTLPIISENLIITTSDGSPLLVFLKGGLLDPWWKEKKPKIRSHLEKAVRDLLLVYKPPKSSPDSRVAEWKSSAKSDHEYYGRYYFGVWTAQGHKEVVPTEHTRRAGYKSNAATNLYRTLAPVSQTVGILFEAIDKHMYDRYCANYNRLVEYTDLYGLHFSKRDCWATLGLLVNWEVAPHFDKQDAKDGYVADLVTGQFEGGELVVPELGVQIALQPDDVIFMRSRLLEHFLAPFRGERYAFVYFQHQNLFEESNDKKNQPQSLRGVMDAKVEEKSQPAKEFVGAETRASKRLRLSRGDLEP